MAEATGTTPIEILEIVSVKAKLATMMIGSPGTGKSAAIWGLADRLDYELLVILGSQTDLTDFAGMPQGRVLGKTPSGREVYGTVNLTPQWQMKIIRKKKVILFLDEYSNTPPAIRAGFLTLIQDRRFPNGEEVPEETIIIAAMNPPEEAADGFEMDPPTQNRFYHIAWDPPAEEWYAGMLRGWDKNPNKAEMQWRRKIVGYVKDNPEMLHKQPKESESRNQNFFAKTSSEQEVLKAAWPSRRSWDHVSMALAHAPRIIYVQDQIIKGFVGYEASAGFRDWLRKHDVINPEEAIADPESVDWKKLSIDDSNLLLRSVIELANSKNAEEVVHLFKVIAQQGRANTAGPLFPTLMKKLKTSNNDKLKAQLMEVAKLYQSVGRNA